MDIKKEWVTKPMEREHHKEAKKLTLSQKSLKSFMSILKRSEICLSDINFWWDSPYPAGNCNPGSHWTLVFQTWAIRLLGLDVQSRNFSGWLWFFTALIETWFCATDRFLRFIKTWVVSVTGYHLFIINPSKFNFFFHN